MMRPLAAMFALLAACGDNLAGPVAAADDPVHARSGLHLIGADQVPAE